MLPTKLKSKLSAKIILSEDHLVVELRVSVNLVEQPIPTIQKTNHFKTEEMFLNQ
jgi:hypothetical protein